jgi:hypothetical protein
MRPTDIPDWAGENNDQRLRRESAAKRGAFGLANDALAEATSGNMGINNALRSQKLTRRMDTARYAAMQRRTVRRARGDY